MSDKVEIVRPDAPRDVVSQQGPKVTSAVKITGNMTVTAPKRGPVVEQLSLCEKNPKGGSHCWHDIGITLTFWPGAAVEQCCHCGSESHRSLAAPELPAGHGPFAPKTTFTAGAPSSQEGRRDG